MVKLSKRFTITTIALVTFSAIDLPKTQAASLDLSFSNQYIEDIQRTNEVNFNKNTLLPKLSITRRNTQKNTDIINADNTLISQIIGEKKTQKQIPKYVLYSLIVLFGLGSILISKFFVFGEEGIFQNLQDKYGKPKVTKSTISMHNQYFKELEKIAIQIERINSKKLGDDELSLFTKVEQSIKKEIGEFKKLGNRSELLQVAIAAQNSFLRIEQTELRFRSRNQQEFYQFVVDSLNQDLDEIKFRSKIKRKLAEIIPIVNTDEGRDALQSYLKEIDKISEHKLGLKLLSLFKEYQLADFTILKRVSDIVNQLEGQDLLQAENLIDLVISDYEIFEKLAPIIGVSKSENSPETYANILQYIGLLSKYKKSYEESQRLLEILKKWQKPYKNITTIRQQYQASEYRLPQEFSQEIPGLNIYKKYEKFLKDN